VAQGSVEGLAELLAGEGVAPQRIIGQQIRALETRYEQRLLPTTRHRLARTLLLTRASRQPDAAADFDRELLRLGETGQRERPHDPQPQPRAEIPSGFGGTLVFNPADALGLVAHQGHGQRSAPVAQGVGQ
jgi:hypothetical protein